MNLKTLIHVCLAILFLAAPQAVGQHKFYKKGEEKYFTAKITSETPKGVQLERLGKTEFLPVDQIDDVEYHFTTLSVRIPFGNAMKAEKTFFESKDTQKKADNLKSALDLYNEVKLKAKTEDNPFGKRHVDYKIAWLTAKKAEFDGDEKTQRLAITYLQEFRKNHPSSWQFVSAMETLAKMHMQLGQYDQAKETYQAMADAEIGKEQKWNARLMIAQVQLRSKQPNSAETAHKTLEELIQEAGSHPIASQAKVFQAEALVLQGKADVAQKVLQGIIATASDPKMKAVAYNTLGLSYYNKKDYENALWKFLWVDVVYNQDSYQHAKALYYLWGVFSQLSETTRAEECRAALMNDPLFAGFEFQEHAKKNELPSAPK